MRESSSARSTHCLGADCYVGIATHDEWLLDEARRLVAEHGLGRDEYEFQMLLACDRVSRRARACRSPPADLRPVRQALVLVLAASPAGKPEDRRLHRRRHRRSPDRAPEREVIWARPKAAASGTTGARVSRPLRRLRGRRARPSQSTRGGCDRGPPPVVHALGDLAEAQVTKQFARRVAVAAKLGVTGEDAVEIALRTGPATGKPGIVAFDGAYHGTGLLALAATGFERFRRPFAPWLPARCTAAPSARTRGPCRATPRRDRRARAGTRGRAGSAGEWLTCLRARCDDAGALLVVDAIYAGLGRVGELWPGHEVADVLCIGKALGGGLPISAALFVRRGARGRLGARCGGCAHAYAHRKSARLLGGARGAGGSAEATRTCARRRRALCGRAVAGRRAAARATGRRCGCRAGGRDRHPPGSGRDAHLPRRRR